MFSAKSFELKTFSVSNWGPGLTYILPFLSCWFVPPCGNAPSKLPQTEWNTGKVSWVPIPQWATRINHTKFKFSSKICNNLHHVHFDMFSIFFSVIASTEPNITLAYRASEEYNLPDLSPRSWHEFALRYRLISNISHTKSQNLDVWRLKSPAWRVFTQPSIQGQIKVNKAPRHWPSCGEFTGDRWIPRTKGQ